MGLALCSWTFAYERETSTRLIQAEAAARQRTSIASHVLRAASPLQDDYTAQLPADPARAADLLNRIQALATKHAVRVGSVHADLAAPSPEHLGRTTLTLALRGPYAGIKAVLASAQSEFPSLTVQSVSLARSPQEASAVELSATLIFWSRSASVADPVASI